MLKRTLAIAFSAAFAAAAGTFVAPLDQARAEMAAPAKEPAKPKKELTPQQQKMKDCAAKWKDEKKAKNVSGRKAYNEFMSKCLKG
jgi:Spy/CpxP family protein refolding chaperone